MSKQDSSWRVVGSTPDQPGLMALECVDADGRVTRRIGADVRGGVCWPFPMRVGTKMMASGACAVVGFVPARVAGEPANAELLWWRQCVTVGVERDARNWPVDPGIAGRMREVAASLHCVRWYSLCNFDDQVDAVRCVRQVLGREMDGIVRITALGEETAEMARATCWRWLSAGRLDLPESLEQLVDTEAQAYQGEGPQPIAMAIGAALRGWQEAPWRAKPLDPWQAIPSSQANQQVRV